MVPTTIFFDLGNTLVSSTPTGQTRFADTLDALQVLAERGYRLGLLSNQATGTTVADVATRLATLGLGRWIETALITISTEIAGNVGKPARPVFDRALAKAAHAAASLRSIFVTEEAAHITAARGFGWRAILLKRTGGACTAGDGECATSLASLLASLPPLADLSGTNLDLAPPPRSVDGLWAVPIDITRIDARLHFDAATQSGQGDANVEFRLGRHAGCPVFDLRQTPIAAWLDGTAVPVSDMVAHDFGGGTDAQLRVLARVLDAGSAHTLRLTYGIGLPQASMAGSYLPAITWSAGPRLAFNFGFTDLGPGRYLEAFVPANLVFDQFELALDLRITGTTVTHTPITNGTVTMTGTNQWRIVFGARTTALSPMLELRAADRVTSATSTVVLPVSGQTVTVTAWKAVGGAADVNAAAPAIAGYLTANETTSGPYAHGDRFTAFVHQGGMEYDGATTSSVGPLRHEAYHSWWGRGVKPASQVDGWFDEGWTEYMEAGGTAVLPFDFTQPPIVLSARNPWVRVTPSASYTAGERVWRGVAALVGAGNLRDLMRSFYQNFRGRPVTTEQVETYLLARTGRPEIVDGFHRFVYGLSDPDPVPDVWLRDHAMHAGEDPWGGRFWDSPDLWVRNRDDGGLDHQNPEFGQDNWLHARVRNRSATVVARHVVVSFNAKNYAGTQFAYPVDFLPAVCAAAAFDLGPGETRILKARWPRLAVPPAGTHPCLLAAVFTRFDAPRAGRAVWEHNNLAQKNLTVVDLQPDAWFVLPVMIANLRTRLSLTIELEIARPEELPRLSIGLILPRSRVKPGLRPLELALTAGAPSPDDAALQLTDCGAPLQPGAPRVDDADARGVGALLTTEPLLAGAFAGAVELPFAPGRTAKLTVTLRPLEALRVGLRVRVPTDARRGSTFTVEMVQRDRRKVVGGVALTVNVA